MEISPLAQFFGSVLIVVISAFLNQKHTNRKINARNETLDGLRKTIDEQATQIENQNEQIASLKEDLKEVRGERDKANEEVGKLQTQIDTLKQDIKDLQAVNTQAALEAVRLTKERDDATGKYHELQADYNKALQDIISMGKQIAQLQDEMDTLRIDIQAYKRVDQIVNGLTQTIGTAIRDGVQQALATSEIMKVRAGENPA